ncbi:ATP-binding protein [Hydrogenobacter sp. T-2]|uniref:ATP-binding protein n=1 Tax=Pampinifervens diazotrophicum TaxID=1632018 RepID=UPI002B260858|nr:ATP-binding protein [Hydrogenobacter sp. T-2]WPM31960.1 ATP-binding protein [Hydrogenobacter sp. T-2]
MRVGIVLGTKPISPLEFWVGVEEGQVVQLDDVLYTEGQVGEKRVKYYGIVNEVQKFLEGAEFVYDAHLVSKGVIPVNIAYVAKVNVTRIEPEVFAPPSPGDPVYRAIGKEFERALYYDQMKEKIPAGVDRNGNVVYINYDFINGVEGAHVSISGMSGIATKTSYALFLLYSILEKASDRDKVHGIIFNVKGKDLLWLDKKNKSFDAESRKVYEAMGLRAEPFKNVKFYVPPSNIYSDTPDCERLDKESVIPFYWSIREFAEEGLIKFMFTEGEEGVSNIHYVIDRISNKLYLLAQNSPEGRLLDDFSRDIESLEDLEVRLEEAIRDKEQNKSSELYRSWFGDAQIQTAYAFFRRFSRACMHISRLIRDKSSPPKWEGNRLSVIDISSLHSIGKMFVVGSILKRVFREKENIGKPYPKVFVVLDELNKYAPKEGWSPIKDVVLDIAERGRSLGVILIGAQQTASEVEKRVVANSALKVLGRMDSSEVLGKEYEYLTGNFRQRAIMLKKGTMILYQPDIPNPMVVRFPKPAWATRYSEVEEEVHVPKDFGNF